jgi:hypothetical protein
MSLFSVIAFAGRIQVPQLRSLLAVAITRAFKDLPIPGHCHEQTLELHRGRDFVRSEIEQAIGAHYTTFQSPAVRLRLKPTREVTLEDERVYLLQKETDIQACMDAIAAQWPCCRPQLPDIPLINQSKASKDCKQLCMLWYQNQEFFNFVQKVQDRLKMTTNKGFKGNNFPVLPPHSISLTAISFRPPDIFNLLRLSLPTPPPKIYPTIQFLRPRAPQWYDTNTELESMIRELYDNTLDPYCRELGENLLDSFDALIEAELPCSSAVLDVRRVLVQYERRLKAQRDSLWNNVYAALEAREERWQEIAGHIVWPQVTIYSVLSLLAIDQWERVPIAWRATLLVLAEIILLLRRSERLLAYYN